MNAADILAVFDAQAEDFTFPGFNNMHYESVDARMHLFRAGDEWALLVEEAVCRAGVYGPTTFLFGCGPLVVGGRDGRDGLITPFDTHVEAATDDDGNIKHATVRTKPIDLAAVRERAEALNVEHGLALMVYLTENARAQLFHTSEELGAYLQSQAAHVLTIEEWCHPDVYDGPKPSESEAFTLVAEVLATGDVAAYAPTEAPNSNDWRMWLARK